MNDRAACGEGVGGRASGGRHDQAVCAIATDEIAIDGQLESDHAGERAFVNDGLVEHVLRLDHFPRAFQFHMEHDARGDERAAREGIFQSGIKLLLGETRQKTKASQVDGQDRKSARSRQACRCEQCAIATENEQELRSVGDLLVGVSFRAGGERSRGCFVADGADAASFQPLQKSWQKGWKRRTAWTGDDADGLEGFSGVHVSLRFYSTVFLRAWRKYS